MPRVALQHGWQAGPASIDADADEIVLDSGGVGTGVLLQIQTTLNVEEASADLGVLTVNAPDAKMEATLTLAASIEQARELRDVLSAIVEATG